MNYEQVPGGKKDANSMWLIAAAVLSVLILGLAFLNFQKYEIFGGESDTASSTPATTEDGGRAAGPTSQTPETAADGFPDISNLRTAASADGGPWVVGLQQDFQYRLAGSVPTEAARTALTSAITATYSDNPALVKNELTVDQSLAAVAWLDSVPAYLQAMPLQLVDGSISVNNEQTALAGIAPAEQFIAEMKAKAAEGNLPPVSSTITIGEGRPPTIVANSVDGKLEMFGNVPNQRLVDVIGEDAVEIWGEGNVTNNMVVDNTTFARFPVVRFAERQLSTYQPLGDFEMRLEQGQLSATVDGGVLFDPGSAEVTLSVRERLQRFPGFLNAAAGRPIFIFGHTDNTGLPAENQLLSQRRAEATKQFFVDSGVDAGRISAEGKGQTEPLESNDTPEGRSKNRRVQITIGNN